MEMISSSRQNLSNGKGTLNELSLQTAETILFAKSMKQLCCSQLPDSSGLREAALPYLYYRTEYIIQMVT